MLTGLTTIIFVASIFFIVLCFGRLVLRILGFAFDATWQQWSMGWGIGWLLVSLVTYAAGLAGWLGTGFFWGFLSLMTLLAFFELRTCVSELMKVSKTYGKKLLAVTLWQKLFFLIVFGILSFSLIGCLAPATGWDADTFHLLMPKLFLREGSISGVDTVLGSYFHLFVQMQLLFLWGLDGQIAAQLSSFFYALILLFTLYKFGRQFLAAREATLAVLLFCSIPAFWFSVYEQLIDTQIVYYFVLAWLALYLFVKHEQKRFLILFAVLLGAVAGMKVTNLLWLSLLPFVIFAFIVKQGSSRQRYLISVGASLIASITAGVWYAYAFLQKSNPVWPFFPELSTARNFAFGAVAAIVFLVLGYAVLPLFSNITKTKRNLLFKLLVLFLVAGGFAVLLIFPVNMRTLAAERLVKLFTSPILMTFVPTMFGGDAPRIGAWPLALMPVFLLSLRHRVRLVETAQRVLAAFVWMSAAFYGLWLLVFDLNDARHILMIFPLLFIFTLIEFSQFRLDIDKLQKKIVDMTFYGFLGLGLLYCLSIAAKSNLQRIPVALGREGERQYLLSVTEPLYPDIKLMPELAAYYFANDHLASNANILLVGEFRWLYLDRDFINGRPDQQAVVDYNLYCNISGLDVRLRELGLTHVIVDIKSQLYPSMLKKLLNTKQVIFEDNGVVLYEL